MLTQERLKELLIYDPETGVFTWRIDRRTHGSRGRINAYAGSVAGSVNGVGYRAIPVDGHRYRASHLAFLFMTGSLPAEEADHEDCDPSNDRWVNLRPASSSNNKWNTRVSKNNRVGLKGAFWCKQTRRWRSQIMCNGVLHHLGRFDTADEAHAAYGAKASELFGNFARAS